MGWPPEIGEHLPRAEMCRGVRDKLAGYSLNPTHERGAAKAQGFASILGITIADLDHLDTAIRAGVLAATIDSVRDNAPYGVVCVIDIGVQGVGEKASRSCNVRTVWELRDARSTPRLVSAYVKP